MTAIPSQSLVSRFWTLERRDRPLIIEALVWLGLARALIVLVPFRHLASLVSRQGRSGRTPNGNGDTVQRIGWAIRACARQVPWRALCFEQGLAAHFMLRKRGIASVLYYGAKPDEDKGLVTHVWVRHGDLDVVGGEDASTFAVLTRFPHSAETSDPC